MTGTVIRVLGIDPGLRRTGWGLVGLCGSRLTYLGSGVIAAHDEGELARRLRDLYERLSAVVAEAAPHEVAVEETFVNTNPQATLKLGQARAIALLVPALASLPVAEYAANLVKKTVVGSGHADKRQVGAMVRVLLPRADPASADAADALAIAITHAHHRGARAVVAAASA